MVPVLEVMKLLFFRSLHFGEGTELGTGLLNLGQALGDGLLGAAQSVVHVGVADLLQLVDPLLGGQIHLLALTLSFHIDGFTGNQLLCLLLCVLDDTP